MKELRNNTNSDDYNDVEELQGYDAFQDSDMILKNRELKSKMKKNKVVFLFISALLVHLLALSQYLLLKYQYLLEITNVGLDVVFGGIVLVYMVLIYCILAEFENEVLQNRPLTLYGIEIRIYKMISIALTVLSVLIIGYQGGKFVLTQSMESLQEVSFFTDLILLGSATLASYLNYRKTNEKAGRKLFRIYVMIWEAIGVMILGLIILYAIAYSILPVGM